MGRKWSRKGWEMMCVISFVFSFLPFFAYYYFLIIISFSDFVITNNSGCIALTMRYHSTCPFRVSAALIGSSVTSRGRKSVFPSPKYPYFGALLHHQQP